MRIYRAFGKVKRIPAILPCRRMGGSTFPGLKSTVFTHKFEIQDPKNQATIETYQVLDNDGNIENPNYKMKLEDDQLVEMYKMMARLQAMDMVLYDAQRQGRISFYMTHNGEEAIQIGSAQALSSEDVIYAQYREAGVLMHRGFTLEEFINQCYSNEFDLGKGRQMPVHYGSKKLNYHTISSPLGTQIIQAAGLAYALKLEQMGDKIVPESPLEKIAVCYFGDGAASEGDFHPAMNFAAVHKCPVIFFCRNNGYAISTPTEDQYAGDGIASRAVGYGIKYIRVDGNDLLAVHEATCEARAIVASQCVPVLIEAMSYRGGHHSTSDDSSRYRDKEEIQYWSTKRDPMMRTRKLLENRSLWDDSKEQEVKKLTRKTVLAKMKAAERQSKRPPISQIFTDVYHDIPPHLQEQQEKLAEHLRVYGENYKMDDYQNDEQYEINKQEKGIL